MTAARQERSHIQWGNPHDAACEYRACYRPSSTKGSAWSG